MFVQWCSDTNSVIKGAQAVAGQGEGWLPLIEGNDFVVNSATQTSKYVLRYRSSMKDIFKIYFYIISDAPP